MSSWHSWGAGEASSHKVRGWATDAGGSMQGERPREKGLTAEARSAFMCWRKGKQACVLEGLEGSGRGDAER